MFVTCRGCGQSVPGGMSSCQFCGASTVGTQVSQAAQAIAGQRSGGGGQVRQYERLSLETPPWIETAYTVCTGAYAVSGLVHIVVAFLVKRGDSPVMAVVVGLIQIGLGVALVLRNDLVRQHIGVFLWISVAMNGLLLFLFTMAALGAGGLMWIACVVQALTVGLSLAIIWLNDALGWEMPD